MQDQSNQKISLLIDDELDYKQAMSLLKTIKSDGALKSKLQRYQLITQVLKNEPCYVLDSDFADRIHQQLRTEPAYFLPAKKAAPHWRKTGLAVAASLVLAVAWVADKIDREVKVAGQQQIAAVSPVEPAPANTNTVNARFKEYLQAHDNSVYINNMTGAHPYAQVVGYQKQ